MDGTGWKMDFKMDSKMDGTSWKNGFQKEPKMDGTSWKMDSEMDLKWMEPVGREFACQNCNTGPG